MDTQVKKKERTFLDKDVLKRFMTQEQIDALESEYEGHLMKLGLGTNRKENLEAPVTEEEMAMLKAYMEETELPVSALEKRFRMAPSTYHLKVGRIAIRMIYQSQKH